MTLDLINPVTLFCQQHALLEANDTVVVAVSGGADSMGLLHVLVSLSSHFNLRLVIAHLNHQLRGEDSQADARFVTEVANRQHLPFFLESHNIGALAGERKQSIEETARQVRYAFLWRVAVRVNALKIAVGHNADDQVETVLMHFLRGSGLNGLSGILPKTNIAKLRLFPVDVAGLRAQPAPFIIRPLLDQPRTAIEAYCQTHQLAPRQDQSNLDTVYFRNRLRHELIPMLETYNPNFRQVVRRTASIIAADNQLFSQHLTAVWAKVATITPSRQVEFNRTQWLHLPLALKRATLRRAVETVSDHLQDIGFDHLEQAINILEKGSVGQKITLPHKLVITLGYGTFIVAQQPDGPSNHPSGRPQILSGYGIKVNIPGITPLPDGYWQLTALFVDATATSLTTVQQVEAWEIYLDAAAIEAVAIAGEITLRSRLPGDVFDPLGLAGHRQKIKDFMINQKIPALERDTIPLLVAGDKILWVCGYRPNEQNRVTPATTRLLHLKFEPT